MQVVRSFIAEEISQHIDDQAEAFLAEGMNPQEAENASVKEMGDPVKVSCWCRCMREFCIASAARLTPAFYAAGGLPPVESCYVF